MELACMADAPFGLFLAKAVRLARACNARNPRDIRHPVGTRSLIYASLTD